MLNKKSSKYDLTFVRENMMGPNSLKVVEELAESLKLEKGMRVLDLDIFGKRVWGYYICD